MAYFVAAAAETDDDNGNNKKKNHIIYRSFVRDVLFIVIILFRILCNIILLPPYCMVTIEPMTNVHRSMRVEVAGLESINYRNNIDVSSSRYYNYRLGQTVVSTFIYTARTSSRRYFMRLLYTTWRAFGEWVIFLIAPSVVSFSAGRSTIIMTVIHILYNIRALTVVDVYT